MSKQLDLAIHEYLHSRGTSRLFGNVFGVLTLIVVGQLSSHLSRYFPPAGVLSPVLRDPFTALATATFLCSQTILDFMRFRLQSSEGTPLTSDPLMQQMAIPKRYRRSFGEDVVAKAWRWRLVFVALFAIAAIRWILSWSRA